MGLSILNEQQFGIAKTRNNIVGSTLKYTNCNCTHNLPPKCTMIIGDHKLADSIYVVVEELKLLHKGKTESTKWVLKQLVELYGDNSRLLLGRLTLL